MQGLEDYADFSLCDGEETELGNVYTQVYGGICVYECVVDGTAVQRRRDDNFVNASSLLAVAQLNEEVAGELVAHGALAGVWIPIDQAMELCERLGVTDKFKEILTFNPITDSLASRPIPIDISMQTSMLLAPLTVPVSSDDTLPVPTPEVQTEFAVKEILDVKIGKGKAIMYQVTWEGYSEATWESLASLADCTDEIAEFHHRKLHKPRSSLDKKSKSDKDLKDPNSIKMLKEPRAPKEPKIKTALIPTINSTIASEIEGQLVEVILAHKRGVGRGGPSTYHVRFVNYPTSTDKWVTEKTLRDHSPVILDAYKLLNNAPETPKTLKASLKNAVQASIVMSSEVLPMDSVVLGASKIMPIPSQSLFQMPVIDTEAVEPLQFPFAELKTKRAHGGDSDDDSQQTKVFKLED